MNTYRPRQLVRAAAWVIFSSYTLFIIYLLFFGFSRSGRTERSYNIVPFKTVWSYFVYFRHYDLDIWIINVFGNVAAFVPFGFFIPWLFPSFNRWLAVAKLLFWLLLAVETLQFVFKVGSFDVDDILLNVLGGLLGFALFVAAMGCKTGRGSIQ
ncbi:VanZ like family protein [Paenibacillus konkukensis]|uniref:VanZ like family protein n=1 Tax=Paenibacillus konkukensis TaxID=2020716 RepID=A0ABY4RI10_9BACL|nr:VanZ family protein [Paenibacillus konkukensis]UQZ82081.1 VanZ like family protein [Paenibacillus konkukensis]